MRYFWQYNPETLQETYAPTLKEGFIKGRLPYEKWPEERKKSYKEKHSISSSEKQKGKVAYNNGIENKYFMQGQDVPEGFIKGFAFTQEQRENISVKSKDWNTGAYLCTNGIKNIRVHRDDEPPEGFVRGHTKWQK